MSARSANARENQERARLRVLMVGIVLALVGLTMWLWRIQVRQSAKYRDDLAGQSMRRVRLPAPRGLIYDRNGHCLVDNEPSYCVAIYVEELRQRGDWSNTAVRVAEVLDEISKIIDQPVTVTHADIMNHIIRRRLLPFLPWRGLDHAAVARLAEHPVPVPGAGIHVEPVRVYREGRLLGHVLGYVGRAEIERDPKAPFHFYLPEIEGKQGIEKRFNRHLAGRAGGRLIRVNADMLKHEVLREGPPTPGNDLRLTVDIRAQRLIEEALSRAELAPTAPLARVRGAAVLLDPRNGDVLAMASLPGYDPGLFVPRISSARWRVLRDDRSKPLTNRAVAENYAPGSIFKPVVAMAALAQGFDSTTRFPCGAEGLRLGPVTFHCWRKYGHGSLDLFHAIEQSCNPYFCQLGLQCGYPAIAHLAETLGLGQKTGVEVDYEVPGVLPNDAWKREFRGDAWRKGDTCNVSIGQGALAVTPVQMAQIVATIANGGTLYRPRLLLKRRRGEMIRAIDWNPRHLALVRDGMHAVVQGENGTARKARVPGVEMAGKTGTAEFGPRSRRRKYTWMIVFAPYRAPRYAMAMVIEDGVSGGTTIAPRVQEIMTGLFVNDGTIPEPKELDT